MEVKRGYLHLQCQQDELLREWKKWFVVVRDGYFFVYSNTNALAARTQHAIAGGAVVYATKEKVKRPHIYCVELATASVTIRCSSDNKTDLDDWHRIMSVFARRDIDEFSNVSDSNTLSRSQSFSQSHSSDHWANLSRSQEMDTSLLVDDGRDRSSSSSVYDDPTLSTTRESKTPVSSIAPSSSSTTTTTLPLSYLSHQSAVPLPSSASSFNPRSSEALEEAREHSYRGLLRQHRTRAEQHQRQTIKKPAESGTSTRPQVGVGLGGAAVPTNYDSIGEHKQSADAAMNGEATGVIVEQNEHTNNNNDPNDNDDTDDTAAAAISSVSPTTRAALLKAKAAAAAAKLKKYAPPSPLFPPVSVPDGSGLYPLVSTDMTQIDELGLSGRLYFRYIRAFAIVTCLMSPLAFYLMAYNKTNPDLSLYDEYGFMFKFSVGNRFAEPEHHFGVAPSKEYGIVGAVILFFILATIIFLSKPNMRVLRMVPWCYKRRHIIFFTNEQTTAKEYSVEFRNLPQGTFAAGPFVQWVQRYFGGVASILFVQWNNRIFSIERKLDSSNPTISITKDTTSSAIATKPASGHRLRSSSQVSEADAELAEANLSDSVILSSVRNDGLKAPLLASGISAGYRPTSPYDGNISDKPQHGLRAITVDTHTNPSDGFGDEIGPFGNDIRLAIVTFVSRDDSHRCLTAYEPRCGRRLCGYQKGTPPRYDGRQLETRQPKDPSDYIWSNLTLPEFGKHCRRMATALLAVILCTGSFILLGEYQTFQKDEADTPGFAIKGYGWSVLMFLYSQFSMWAISWMSDIEQRSCRSSAEVSNFRVKVLLETLQLCVVPFLVFEIPKPYNKEPRWYQEFGSLITGQLLSDAGVSVLMAFFQPAALVKQSWAQKTARSQTQLNAAFEWPPMAPWQLFASLFTSTNIALFYCTLIPILIPITAVKLTCIYWIEKYNVLRRYPRPPSLDGQLAKYYKSLIPYGVIGHAALACLAFRPPCDWSAEVQAINNCLSSIGDAPAVRPYLIAGSALTFLAIYRVLVNVFKCCCGCYCTRRPKDTHPKSYYEVAGIGSYPEAGDQAHSRARSLSEAQRLRIRK